MDPQLSQTTIEFIQFLEKIGPWGIVGIFLFFILKPLIPEVKDWIRSKIPAKTIKAEHEQKLDTLNQSVTQLTNHSFHKMEELLVKVLDGQMRMQSSIDRAIDASNRNWADARETLVAIKTKLNL